MAATTSGTAKVTLPADDQILINDLAVNPASGSGTDYGPHPEDWIYWQENRPDRPFEEGRIVVAPFIQLTGASREVAFDDLKSLRTQPSAATSKMLVLQNILRQQPASVRSM